ARTIEVLMMLLDRKPPLSEPRRQGCDEAPAFERVIADLLPLLLRRPGGLVQYLGVDGELAHVVQERRPAEPVPVPGRQLQLVGDHVREGADPFGVPAGTPVVAAQRS